MRRSRSEVLRDQVLGEPERDPVVGRRDPEDVRPALRVDDPLAAFEDDADRHARARRDAPRGVDAGAFVDDRDRVVVDRAPDVRDGAGGRERAVQRLDPQVVGRAADADAAARSPRRPRGGRRSRSPGRGTGVRENGALTATWSVWRGCRVACRRSRRAATTTRRTREQRHATSAAAEVGRSHALVGGDLVRRARRRSRGRRRARRPGRRAGARPREVVLDDHERRGPRLAATASSVDERARLAPRDAPAVGSSTSRTGAPGRIRRRQHQHALLARRELGPPASSAGQPERGEHRARPRATNAASSARACGVAKSVRKKPPRRRRPRRADEHVLERGQRREDRGRLQRADDAAAAPSIVPASGAIAPASRRRTVVLPEPFGPTSAVIEPGVDGERDVRRRRVIGPKRFVRPGARRGRPRAGAVAAACPPPRRPARAGRTMPSQPSETTASSMIDASSACARDAATCSSEPDRVREHREHGRARARRPARRAARARRRAARRRTA